MERTCKNCGHTKDHLGNCNPCLNGNCWNPETNLSTAGIDWKPIKAPDNEKLKLCPFCGSPAGFDEHEAYSLDSSFDYIGCKNNDCGAMMINGTVEEWNRRYNGTTTS